MPMNKKPVAKKAPAKKKMNALDAAIMKQKPLKSKSGKGGPVVKSRKQAIAIALSEAGKSKPKAKKKKKK